MQDSYKDNCNAAFFNLSDGLRTFSGDWIQNFSFAKKNVFQSIIQISQFILATASQVHWKFSVFKYVSVEMNSTP